jgi:hypothetical protein
MMKVFWADVELKPLLGSFHYGKCKGLFVDCYLLGKDEKDAKKRLLDALQIDKYHLISLEDIRLFEDVCYEDDQIQHEAECLAKKASKSFKLVYGPFYTYARK